ncbi:Gfo/Idh/MocA family protein [Calditrichota bacterium]
MRVGVIGYGYWGPNLVRNYMESEKTELVYVCDLREQVLEGVTRKYPTVKITTSISEVLESDELDAVSIATPVDTHYELTIKALQAGKHVLVEKPMADSSEKCQRMIQAAKDAGKILMVDHTFPYTGAIEKIQQLLDSGELGTMQYFDSTRINLGLFQHDVSVIWDLAVHDLSIMEALFDYKPYGVSATGIAHVEGSPVNTAFMTLYYNEPFIAHINVSWLAPVKLRQTLIGGSDKMVLYDDMEPEEKVKIYDKGITLTPNEKDIIKIKVGYRTGDMTAPKLRRIEALSSLVNHFADVVEKGVKPITSAESGARIVRILEAATESLKLQGTLIKL